MSQSVSSPSLTPKDSKITLDQPNSPATALSDHCDETEITHKESTSVTAASDHSDDTDDTASTHEEPSSPITAPSDISDDAATSATPADATDTKVSPTKDEVKERKPLSKVQELAAWYDLQANGNLRLQVLTWDGRAVDAPKHESKKTKKTPQAEEGLM